MRVRSLCGCLVRDLHSALGFRAFNDLVAKHYKEHPECRKRAEQDPVWQMRSRILKEEGRPNG